MSRPRILVLFGGVVLFGQERGNMEALSALQKAGCDILFLVRDDDWSIHLPPALSARELEFVKIPYFDPPRSGTILRSLLRTPKALFLAHLRFFKILREFRPTHIHACNQAHVMNFILALAMTTVPLVFRAGDEPTLHNFFWRFSWSFIVRRTQRFVANSEFVARSMVSTGVPRDSITLIYNAPPSRPALAEKSFGTDLPTDARVFGFIGQIADHKGPHFLVDAFRLVAADYPRACLVIAGRISDWEGDAFGRQLRDRVARDPLIAGRVRFVGEIADVPGMLARCEVLVVPSLFPDPSPNVAMEAKQAGRAAIVFPRGGLPELVEDGVDGLVCPEPTVPALAAALRRYLDDPELAALHGVASRESLARLGVDGFCDKWSDVYNIKN